MFNIDDKVKTDTLEAMDALHIAFPLLEQSDFQYCSSLLHKCVRLVESYGYRHGVNIHVKTVKEKVPFSYDDIKRVIFNNDATIVLWKDGTKTVVKCTGYDLYDSEKGLAMAIVKKAFGNRGRYNDVIRKLLNEADYQ